MVGTAGASVVHLYRIDDEVVEGFARWTMELTRVSSSQPGFVEIKILPPIPDQQPDWVVVERFSTPDDAVAWVGSGSRAELSEQVEHLLSEPSSVSILTESEPARESTVTAVITNHVKPECQEEFMAWRARISDAQSKFPGYRGADVQAPIEGVSESWVTLLRFDTAENLRNWLDSGICEALRAESKPMMEEAGYRLARTSFTSWLPAEERNSQPPTWKVNAIVLLVLYPVVVLEIIYLYPPLQPTLGVGVTTFIANFIGVWLTGSLLVPWASQRLKRWLVPLPIERRRVTIIGTGLLLLAYAVLITVMSLWAIAVLG